MLALDDRAYLIDRRYRDSTTLSENQFYSWLQVKNSGPSKEVVVRPLPGVSASA